MNIHILFLLLQAIKQSFINNMSQIIPQCPILSPTYQQFKNFQNFVNSVEDTYRKDYGMVKIIPPPEWISRSQNYTKILKQLKIVKPQHQTLYAKNNHFYQCENGKTHHVMTLREYKALAEQKYKQIRHKNDLNAIERQFWQIAKNIDKQLYCANIEETLMDKTSGQWDLSHLTSMFSHAVKEKLNGLNTSFLFIGAWRTFFNWHIEDLDLSAINLLHQGRPKVWYSVHPEDRKKFEGILKDIFPENVVSCTNFLRHKSTFVNPYKLKQKYPFLRISKMYQQQNQISLAFSQGYHCGFNMGFNIAQAVNYGTDRWLDKLSKFRGCKCEKKVGVEIESYDEIVKNLTKSPAFKKIKDSPSFKKIQQKAAQQVKEDQEFQKIPKDQVYKQFLKEKTKKINKDLKEIYVPKFKRYFDHNYTQQVQIVDKHMQCEQCQKWRKVDENTFEKYQKISFACKLIGINCKKIKNMRILRSDRAKK